MDASSGNLRGHIVDDFYGHDRTQQPAPDRASKR